MPDLTFGTVSLDSLTKDGSWGLLVFFPGAFVSLSHVDVSV